MTAYAPRIFAGPNSTTWDINDDTETAIGTVTVYSTTNVTERVLLEVTVELSPGTDTSAIAFHWTRGDIATGQQIITEHSGVSDPLTVPILVSPATVDDLGPDVIEQLYTLSVTCADASGGGGAVTFAIRATVF